MRIVKIFFFSIALTAFVSAAESSLYLNTEPELKAKQKSMQDHCERAATLPCAVGIGKSNSWDNARNRSKEDARAKLSRIASKMDSKVVGNAVITKEESGKIIDSVTGKSSYVVITMLTMKSLTVTPIAPESVPAPVPAAAPEPMPEPTPVTAPAPEPVPAPAPVITPSPAPAHIPAPPATAQPDAPKPIPPPPPPTPPPPTPKPPPAATEPPKQEPAPAPPPERHTRGKVILK